MEIKKMEREQQEIYQLRNNRKSITSQLCPTNYVIDENVKKIITYTENGQRQLVTAVDAQNCRDYFSVITTFLQRCKNTA